jgi:RimJ/RimL family protein N-acetyltransferase
MAVESDSQGCRQGLVEVGRLSRDDREAVLEVFEGLSDHSRSLRFHGPKPRLGPHEVDRLVDVGCCGREAVLAVDRLSGRIVGIARFVRDDDDPRSAEVAFEVVDDCQGAGVGGRLVDELRTLALREGVERFRAYVAAGNEAALALLRRSGRVTGSRWADGAYEVVVELDPLARAA